MKISEKELGEMFNLTSKHYLDGHLSNEDYSRSIEVYRLARLGLMHERLVSLSGEPRVLALADWAEDRAIPALKYFSNARRRTVADHLPDGRPIEMKLMIEADSERADEALAALPRNPQSDATEPKDG